MIEFEFVRPAWHGRAACRGMDEVMFSEDAAGIARAKAVCACCPVSPDCLAWALRNRPAAGVWGGHTVDEIRRLVNGLGPRRQRRGIA